MKTLILTLLLGLASLGGQARAEVMVLVHGYLGSAASWSESGVLSGLAAQGWKPAGILAPVGGAVRLLGRVPVAGEKTVYTVELPSLAPIVVQAQWLGRMLGTLSASAPNEPLWLVGHSAGGVVARALLVMQPNSPARGLITIASPHLGTGRAVQALDYTEDGFPFNMLKSFFSGGTYELLEDSRGVLVDLVPARPGSFLEVLNRQPHPAIRYAAIVRHGPVGLGDELVPAFSQDLNQVPVLAGRAQRLTAGTGHALVPQDAWSILEAVRGMTP